VGKKYMKAAFCGDETLWRLRLVGKKRFGTTQFLEETLWRPQFVRKKFKMARFVGPSKILLIFDKVSFYMSYYAIHHIFSHNSFT